MNFSFQPSKEEGAHFLGGGFGFPLRVSVDGGLRKSEGLQHISACVARLQLYNNGDYPGVYTLGGNISGMVFGVNAMNNLNSIQKDCENSVENFEDRVSSTKVRFFRDGDTSSNLNISTEYTIDKILATNSDVLEVRGV